MADDRASQVAPSPSRPDAADPSGNGGRPAATRQRGHFRRTRQLVVLGRARVDAARNRLEETLVQRRQTDHVVAAGFRIWDLDIRVGGVLLAGAVAFRLFLFMVPYVYVLFTILGAFAPAVGTDPEHLAKTLGITGVLASAVVSTHSLSVWSQIALLIGATVLLALTTNTLTKTIFAVHWLVWRTQRVRPVGTTPMLTVLGIMTLMTVGGVTLNALRNATGFLGSIGVALIIAGVSFLVWWWSSIRLPHRDAPPKALLPGAVLMGVGVVVLHLLTTYWMGHLVARKSNTYGAVGISLAVLFWVYVLGRIIVGSAGINAALWQAEEDAEDAEDTKDAQDAQDAQDAATR